ncbi:MAG: ATP-binding protein [SAR324 cluster bacterium]|uniref:ATP-binding protein n=1 Tax=SAR324 cluster bacterium TaxID=2024889 RepID=A0A7X9IIE6_9DELT|nr:ATP-binding protein [SAR324 cluster bacterium]
MKTHLTDIVLKDIISCHQIRNKRVLDLLIAHYFSNLSSLHSYNARKNAFGLSIDIVTDYTCALSEAFIRFEIPWYHPNLKVQSRDPKTAYVIDSGLRRAASRSAQHDSGKILENLVFLELKRKEAEVFYFKEKQEVDFVVTEDGKSVGAIQICASNLKDSVTKKCEIRALFECMENLILKSSIIISLDREENIKIDSNRTIKVIPAHQWFLMPSKLI